MVRYPFHPLYGQTLEVTTGARHADGSHTVVAPDGSQLKVPVWMTVPEAETHVVSAEAVIGSCALLHLLVTDQIDTVERSRITPV